MTPGQRLLRRRKAEVLRARIAHGIEVAATKLCGAVPFFVDKQDLIGEGWLRALAALQSYDASRGASRVTWATTCARGEMLHYLRTEARRRGVPRREWEQHECVLREVPMETAARIGEDGLADRAAAKHLVDTFIEGLSGIEKTLCEAVRDGEPTIRAALCRMGQTGGNSGRHKARLRGKLEDAMLRGKHREGLVL